MLNLKYWHINIHAIVEEHYEKYFHQEGEYMTNIMLMDNGEEFSYGGPLWHVYSAVYCCVLALTQERTKQNSSCALICMHNCVARHDKLLRIAV